MPRYLSVLFFFVFSSLSTLVHAELPVDIFWGMLKKHNDEMMFVRCDKPSLEMKIIKTKDSNDEHIADAFELSGKNDTKPVYFAFLGFVKISEDGSYTFNLQDVVDTRSGSCNLQDALSNSFQ